MKLGLMLLSALSLLHILQGAGWLINIIETFCACLIIYFCVSVAWFFMRIFKIGLSLQIVAVFNLCWSLKHLHVLFVDLVKLHNFLPEWLLLKSVVASFSNDSRYTGDMVNCSVGSVISFAVIFTFSISWFHVEMAFTSNHSCWLFGGLYFIPINIHFLSCSLCSSPAF